MESNKPAALHIRALFSNGNNYTIPIYQRNYEWTEQEITQLIQDIIDASKRGIADYYIGTLVVYKRKNADKVLFETIDGQQRLTTLCILICALRNSFKVIREDIEQWFSLNLDFDSRPLATQTLNAIYLETIQGMTTHNAAIKQAYYDINKAVKRISKEGSLTIENFYNFLSEKVKILRVAVPEKTDLNHYFEIMNNRGEQLEKHEILKAGFLDVIKEDDKSTYTFNLVWEACSNMEKYVQYGFGAGQRGRVFGEGWDEFSITHFDELADKVYEAGAPAAAPAAVKLSDLIKNNIGPKYGKEPELPADQPERFSTVINFSNFLLHVLRIQMKEDISLDDKLILSEFEKHLKRDDKTSVLAFVKLFGFNLLKCKFLFDKYIIKRELSATPDGWSLKQLRCYKKNKAGYINTFGDENETENTHVRMLLGMFHVSAPTQAYKHWLNASMKYIFENTGVNGGAYINFLEGLGRAYLYDRHLSTHSSDYFEIIYGNNGISKNTAIDRSLLNQGTGVENFIFNYLDYLLWRKYRSRFAGFEFTFRSSVEHYYPQTPKGDCAPIDKKYSDSFGNLCLISSEKNSMLSNQPPAAKKSYYHGQISIDSIKQKIMMDYADWGTAQIQAHGKEMEQILLEG